MSNPDPHHDAENVREDDDLRRTEEDARKYAEDETEARRYDSARDASLKIAAYATQRKFITGTGFCGTHRDWHGEYADRQRQMERQMRDNHAYSDSLKGKK